MASTSFLEQNGNSGAGRLEAPCGNTATKWLKTTRTGPLTLQWPK